MIPALHDIASRRIVKCAWRLANQHPDIHDEDMLVQASGNVAWVFHLTPTQHRLCARLALHYSAAALGVRLMTIEQSKEAQP